MRLEVVADGRGSITIETDGEYSKKGLLQLVEKATGWANELKPAENKKPPFGFSEES